MCIYDIDYVFLWYMNIAYMGVSWNGGTPKSSILKGFSIINHPFWGTLIFGNTHIYIYHLLEIFSLHPSWEVGLSGLRR